jgi:chemotaxis protein CheX
MKVEWINPFLKASIDTFNTMMSLQVVPGKPELLKSGGTKDLSGVIGLSGPLRGVVVMAFDEKSALNIVEKFVGERYETLNADVADAVGEIANIVVGYAKKYFTEQGLDISLPSVIRGPSHNVSMPKGVPAVRIPVHSEVGDFAIEIAIKAVEE